jgi:hypothetical protein
MLLLSSIKNVVKLSNIINLFLSFYQYTVYRNILYLSFISVLAVNFVRSNEISHFGSTCLIRFINIIY